MSEIPFQLTEDDVDSITPYGYIKFGPYYVHLRELSRQSNIGYTHLWRVITGRRPPSVKFAAQIAAILGMSLPEFFQHLPSHPDVK